MPQNKPKKMLNFFRSIFATPQAPSLSELAKGTCVLPAPPVSVNLPKAAKMQDAYIEREETNTWGFRQVSARPSNDGSVASLTDADVAALVDRGLWGGREVVDVNVRCKALWHEGKSVTDAAKILKRSESWTEKRYGAFSAALSVE